MKTFRRKTIMLVFLTLLSTLSMAQPEWDDEPTDTPIDGGIALLIIAGALQGYKSLSGEKKQE